MKDIFYMGNRYIGDLIKYINEDYDLPCDHNLVGNHIFFHIGTTLHFYQYTVESIFLKVEI